MKKFIIPFLTIISLTISISAQNNLTIKEVDGSPSKLNPTQLVVPNGTLQVIGNKVIFTPAGGGGGSGTVTTVSVTTANGVSGSVANATSTPAITLTLGAITPTRVTTTAPTANTTPLTITGYSLTAANTQPLINLAGTWNVGSAVPTAIKLNITDTGSNANSLFIDLQKGGVSQFSVNKGGVITANGAILNGLTVGPTSNIILDATESVHLGESGGAFLNVQTVGLNQWHAHPENVMIDTVGVFTLGDYGANNGNTTGIKISDAADNSVRINALGSVIIGDAESVATSTRLVVDETNSKVTISKPTVIGATTPDDTALLTLTSTTLGFLPPRMTTTERDAIVSPAEGLFIHNSTTHATNYFNGTIWTNGSGVPSSRTITATSPVTIDGTTSADLSANRTIACATCSTNASALTANLPVIGGGLNALAVGTRSGNTTQFVTTTGTLTNGDCVKIDASGNFIANGSACGGSGTTINTTDGTMPVRSNSTTFVDSPVAVSGTNISVTGNISSTGGTFEAAGNMILKANATSEWIVGGSGLFPLSNNNRNIGDPAIANVKSIRLDTSVDLGPSAGVIWYTTSAASGAALAGMMATTSLIEVNNGTLNAYRDLITRQYFADATITAGGTTGNRTINKSAGTVNIAAAGSSVTVTNSLASASSLVYAVARTNDATCVVKNVVPGSGSFVITMTAACTAETSIGFWILNK